MIDLLLKSFVETIGMVAVSTLLSLLIGLPLAVQLFTSSPDGIRPTPWLYRLVGAFVNIFRSIPYIILMVLLIPLTRILVGSAIGTAAAVIPLSLAGSLLIARLIEDSLRGIPKGLIEVGISMGATHAQIIRKILLPEALPSIIAGLTTVIINIIGFSAMAGTVGGGGLGDFAIRFGYQRYNVTLMLVVVAILVALVYLVQMIGDYWVKQSRK